MSLVEWRPREGKMVFDLVPKMLVAYEWAAWRVMRVEDHPEESWSDAERKAAARGVSLRRVTLRPAAEDATWENSRSDLHGVLQGRPPWFELPDHYSVCHSCGDVPPCRHVEGDRAAEAGLKRMARYETEGVCPACSEPVSHRQKSIRFDENVEIPGGPPVVFHLRQECRWRAREYEKRWAAAGKGRRAALSCKGHLTNHGDGTYSCTAGSLCPNSDAEHASMTVCSCPQHQRGMRHCRPVKGAWRV